MSSTTAAEVLLTSINRGEMDGGLWSSESSGGHDKFVMYGGLKIQVNKYEGPGHSGPSKFVKGETTFGYDSQQMHSQKVVELPLGDVWAYDLVTDCWEKITNNYGKPIEGEGKDTENSGNEEDPTDDDLWYDVDISLYPRPRTAHAAAVVGNDLVIHGGMGWNEHTNDWDGSTDWETLSDMWILDLNTRQWKRRYLFPQLVRSYHSLVGWHVDESMMKHDEAIGNATTWEVITSWDGPVVAAFGGETGLTFCMSYLALRHIKSHVLLCLSIHYIRLHYWHRCFLWRGETRLSLSFLLFSKWDVLHLASSSLIISFAGTGIRV